MGFFSNGRGAVTADTTAPDKLGKYYANNGYSPDDLSAEISHLSTSAQMEAIASYEQWNEYLMMLEGVDCWTQGN